MGREPEKFEKDLLMEAEGLDLANRVLDKLDEILAQVIEAYGEYFDPNLVMLLEAIRYDVNITLSGTVKLENGTLIPGVVKQLADVLDEIQVLQCGKKTKGGVPDEDIQEDDSG